MKARRFVVSRVLAAVVAPALALLLVAPSPSLAHGPKPPPAPPSFFASAVAYEVAEHLRFKGGAGEPDNFRVRLARATLLGQILFSVETEGPIVGGDFFDADGRSFVKATGTGPFVATLNTLEDFDPFSMSLSTMEVKGTGTLKGELDLTPLAETPPRPVAFLNNARWRIRHLRGSALGVFLIPFHPVDAVLAQLPVPPAVKDALRPVFEAQYAAQFGAANPGNAPTNPYVYPTGGPLNTCFGGNAFSLSLDPGTGPIPVGTVCPVGEGEILFVFPLTKLEMVLFR